MVMSMTLIGKAGNHDCWICGDPGEKRCRSCRAVEAVVGVHWRSGLSLFVDGSFVTASGERDRRAPRVHRARYAALKDRIAREHPDWGPPHVDAALTEALVGTDLRDAGPGHGGAGLVLAAPTGEILASRSCTFSAESSSDAELSAVIRGARWAPGVIIYTDSESTCWAALSSNDKLVVRFLREHDRGVAHAFAHQLSVDGRLRHASRVTAHKEQS